MLRRTLAAVAAATIVMALTNCGGGSSDPPTTPGGSAGEPAATITIRADGTLSPAEVSISLGQTVRFINQDSRQHHPTSNPHLQHTDCLSANLPVLSPGQSATSVPFNTSRACGIHDHLNPDSTGLHGVIRVGGAQGPGGPVYVKQ
jgi:plastocyanin